MTCQTKKLLSFIYKYIYSLNANNTCIYGYPWIFIKTKVYFSGVWQSQTIPTGPWAKTRYLSYWYHPRWQILVM